MKNTKKALAALALVASVALTGCTGVRETPADTLETTAPQQDLTMEEAKTLALDALKLTEADFVRSGREDGAYEFHIVSGDTRYEVEVNIRTGVVTEVERKDRRTAREADILSEEKIREIALTYLGLTDAEFVKIHREHDEYELKLNSDGREYELEINAHTGAVTELDRDHSSTAGMEPTTTAP